MDGLILPPSDIVVPTMLFCNFKLQRTRSGEELFAPLGGVKFFCKLNGCDPYLRLKNEFWAHHIDLGNTPKEGYLPILLDRELHPYLKKMGMDGTTIPLNGTLKWRISTNTGKPIIVFNPINATLFKVWGTKTIEKA